MRQWLGGEATRSALAVAGGVVLIVVTATMGWAMLRPGDNQQTATFLPAPASTASATSTPTLTSTPNAATPTPIPGRTRSPAPVRQTTPAPRPTEKPPAAELPPPPPPPAPTTGPSCPTFNGGAAPYPDVRTALNQAGGTNYWARPGVNPAQGIFGPVDLPPITVPTDLMNAIAMTESTWRSNVIACDGGIGTMQIMPGTATWMNGRFNSNFDVNTLGGNTRLGAAYLEWLTVYYGIFYFGEQFNLDTTAPVGPGGSTVRLRNAVIAAYNVGYASVENDHGTDDPSDDTLEIPNQWYVDRVNGYRANCPCDAL